MIPYGRQDITQGDIDAIEERVQTEVQGAVDFAEAGTFEPIEQLTKFTYSNNSHE